MAEFRIVPTEPRHHDGFRHAVGVVARERRWLALVEITPVEETRAFLERLVRDGGVQFVAVDEHDAVVGWCDIVRNGMEGFRHTGHLGMGLLPEVRGRGLGRRLAEAAIGAARAAGIERIELEVFASNSVARALYDKLGFVVEGVKKGARRVDGRVDDIVLMALAT